MAVRTNAKRLKAAAIPCDTLITAERGAVESVRDGKLTFADAVVEFRQRGYRVALAGRPNRQHKPIKDRTRAYYEERITLALDFGKKER